MYNVPSEISLAIFQNIVENKYVSIQNFHFSYYLKDFVSVPMSFWIFLIEKKQIWKMILSCSKDFVFKVEIGIVKLAGCNLWHKVHR